MDELQGSRLEASRAAWPRLRPAVERREPWPLSEAYGAEPESDWGPKEVLAHVAEMVPYWLGQIESILAGAGGRGPVRAGGDGSRAHRPDRAGPGAAGRRAVRADRRRRWRRASLGGRLDAAPTGRRGIHPRLGEMTVEAIGERFIIGHLEEHVRQLEEILDRRGEGGQAGPAA